jgi:hypothetical protein
MHAQAVALAQSGSSDELQQLRAEIDELRDTLVCGLCFDRRRDTLLFPCGHLQCATPLTTVTMAR